MEGNALFLMTLYTVRGCEVNAEKFLIVRIERHLPFLTVTCSKREKSRFFLPKLLHRKNTGMPEPRKASKRYPSVIYWMRDRLFLRFHFLEASFSLRDSYA